MKKQSNLKIHNEKGGEPVLSASLSVHPVMGDQQHSCCEEEEVSAHLMLMVRSAKDKDHTTVLTALMS